MYVVELPVSKRTLSAEWKSDITTLLTTNVSFFILITIPQHFMNTLLVRKLRSWTGNIVQHITQITCIVSGFPGNRPALTHHVIRSKTTGKFIYLSKALESVPFIVCTIIFFYPFNGFTCFPDFQCTACEELNYACVISKMFPRIKFALTSNINIQRIDDRAVLIKECFHRLIYWYLYHVRTKTFNSRPGTVNHQTGTWNSLPVTQKVWRRRHSFCRVEQRQRRGCSRVRGWGRYSALELTVYCGW